MNNQQLLKQPLNPLDYATPEQLAELDRLHRMSRDEKLLDHIDRLATEIGRLRRIHGRDDELTDWALDRISNLIDWLALILEPSAGEIVAWWHPNDEHTIQEAVRIVDDRTQRRYTQLGWNTRP